MGSTTRTRARRSARARRPACRRSRLPRAVERAKERGSKQTFNFDFQPRRLLDQRPGPVYHHTAPILHIYALHEALRLILEEGLEARWRRHQAVGDYAQAQIRERADSPTRPTSCRC